MMIKISAWKSGVLPSSLTPCDVNDEDALRWDVSYPSKYQVSINFDDRQQAEIVHHALILAFDAGKQQAMLDLRNFIGVK